MMFLVAIGTALLFAIHVNTGGPGSLCPGGREEWENYWNNNSHPIGDEDHEPIPDDAQYICPTDEGRLLVKCTADDDHHNPNTFTGMFYDNVNKFEVECSAKNGSVCRVSGKGGLCRDFALQIGCDCTKPQGTTKHALSTTPGTAQPANCGPATTPKTTTNCSCPARNSPRQNSAPPCSLNVEFFALAVCLGTVLLQH